MPAARDTTGSNGGGGDPGRSLSVKVLSATKRRGVTVRVRAPAKGKGDRQGHVQAHVRRRHLAHHHAKVR